MSVRDQDYYSDGGHDSGSAHLNAPKTREEAMAQYERLKHDNMHALKNIQFDVDEKTGESSFLGIPISKEMKPVVELGFDTVRPWIIDQSSNVSKIAEGLTTSVFPKISKPKVELVGKITENVFRWGVVGTKQIFDTIRASGRYHRERKDLYEVLSPVMQNTGANLKNNEVIKVAYDDVHSNWMADIRKVVADIPSLIPMAIFAMQDQMKVAAGRKQNKGDPKLDGLLSKAEKDEAFKLFNGRRDEINHYYDEKIKAHPHEAEVLREAQREDVAALRNAFTEGRLVADAAAKAEDPAKTSEKYSNIEKVMWGLIPLTGIIGQKFKSDIDADSERRNKRARGWKMIEHLKVELDNHCQSKIGRTDQYGDCQDTMRSRNPEDVRISGIGDMEGDYNLKEYLIQLFQQHERDREPNRKFYDKKTGKPIDPLKGAMLNKLTPAVEVIAEELLDGRISGDALYKLVGEGMVVKHGKNGARTFASADETRKVIEKELAPVLGTREVVKMEEFMAKFADPALIEGALKNNLKSMQGLEKALFASLFPDDILLQAGMKKKEILQVRKRAHDYAYDFVASTVLHLSKKSPDEMKGMGMTEQEADAIRALAERIEKGDEKAVKLAVDGHDKSILDAARTAGLLEQVKNGEKGKTFWADRVKEMGATRTALKAAKKKAETEIAANSSGADGGHDRDWGREQNAEGRDDPRRDSISPAASGRDGERNAEWSNPSLKSGGAERFKGSGGGYANRERGGSDREVVGTDPYAAR